MTFFLLFITSLYAGTALETSSFQSIEEKVAELSRKYGAQDVLVVFDIDNTILTMPQDLGSDQWFNWQYELCIGPQKADANCVARSMDELLDIQGQLFAISNMVPTEPVTAEVIKRIQAKGHKVILLTSRGYEFRAATERALGFNNMNFGVSAIGPKETCASPYLPYDIAKPGKNGLTKSDVDIAKLKAAKPVTYYNGLYMTAGQHKGVMLKTLLNKFNSKFKAIIFSDDHERHTTRMQDIFGAGPTEMITFRYAKMDDRVQNFVRGDKSKVISAWKTLKEATQKALK